MLIRSFIQNSFLNSKSHIFWSTYFESMIIDQISRITNPWNRLHNSKSYQLSYRHNWLIQMVHNCQFETLSGIHVISVIKCFNVQPHGKSWKVRQDIVLALSHYMYLCLQNGAFLRAIFFVNDLLCIHAQIDLCKRVLHKYFVSIWC